MFEGLSEKIGVSGCQLFDKVGFRQGGFAFAQHGDAVFFGEVFRVDVVAVTKMAKTDELKSSEVLFDNCWLGGSSAMRQDAVLFLEATKQLGTMLNSCSSCLKNL
ncbi:MAG: hypothetical protein IJW01_04430 [Paludibacteraceae bacterium]|nr:hypothetical protein [Paludibacteraceae bacterium]